MNGRQAAKKAAKHITELEDFNRRCSADIKQYNLCIFGMIKGESPCKWCMDRKECERAEKDARGCEMWWLTDEPVTDDTVEGEENDSEGIHGASPEG